MRIHSRAEWDARFARGFGPAPLPARGVYLHHSASRDAGVAATLDQDAATVRRLEEIGQERFGGGISYTFAVTPSGRVYEGHGIDRRGAHTKGCNSTHRAIVLVGDYSKRAPTQAQLTAVVALLEHGREQGWWRVAALAGGHRDAPGAATSCPGDGAYGFIDDINRAAAAGEEDGMSAEDSELLREIHREVTQRLANRRGPAGRNQPGGGAETLLGYSANADGMGYRIEASLARIERLLGQLVADEPARGVPLYPKTEG